VGANLRAGANPVGGGSAAGYSSFEEFGAIVPSELYEVNCLLPEQGNAFDQHRGVRELFEAVLGGAIHDLGLPEGPIQKNARRWIENGFVGDINFNEACDYLGLDASAVRRRALEGLVETPRRNLRGITRRRVVEWEPS